MSRNRTGSCCSDSSTPIRQWSCTPTVWRKADIRHKQFFSPGNYRAEVVSCRSVEPMGTSSPRVSDVKILRDATTRDTTWRNWIRVAFLNDIVHVVFTGREYRMLVFEVLVRVLPLNLLPLLSIVKLSSLSGGYL